MEGGGGCLQIGCRHQLPPPPPRPLLLLLSGFIRGCSFGPCKHRMIIQVVSMGGWVECMHACMDGWADVQVSLLMLRWMI